MKYFISCFMIAFICSCTYNVSMAHTEGTAEDVIDDTASNSPTLSPNIPSGFMK